MNEPTMMPARLVASDVHLLGAYTPVPGFGVLPVNAYLINSVEPVLVDTGLASLRTPFLAELKRVLDPADVRWIWLTHVDADHVGNLAALLDLAPQARVITTFLGMGKMGMLGLPLDRVYLLNPGQSLDLPDRSLQALRPPIFDAPETTALFDSGSRTYFSADCFGCLMPSPAESAADLSGSDLRDGILAWTAVDAPWLQLVDSTLFRAAADNVNALRPEMVLGSHLPPAAAMLDQLLGILSETPAAGPFVGPDQAALESMLQASN